MFTPQDKQQAHKKGISLETIEKQIQNFKDGFPFARLVNAAVIDHGIEIFSDEQIDKLIRQYDELSQSRKVIKFVPASGAATRMFKALYEFRGLPSAEKDIDIEDFTDKSFNSPYYFFKNLNKFAFYDELREVLMNKGIQLEDCLSGHKYDEILDAFLTPEGMDYGQLPKGLLKFHSYEGFSRTSMGEHMVEGAHYCKNSKGDVNLHFTVSPEHMMRFKKLVSDVQGYYEKKFGVNYQVDFSIQKPSTDTLAVDLDNEAFRNDDGTMLFRPGGHGALIENLNEMDADIVFVKNIDNVVPDALKEDTYRYKKAIGGLLLLIQDSVFEHLRGLENASPDANLLDDIASFYKDTLGLDLPENFDDLTIAEKAYFFKFHLNRPIRVCGMVKNEGEPGGGPFWVEGSNGETGLQIIESSQINSNDEAQDKILNHATHFNPVDLVCGIKNFKGEKFDLHEFIDPETGFISIKSKDGKQLKAQELPGLWNGAMALWITLFVEVPIITFNPVKTVNDLLRDTHQA